MLERHLKNLEQSLISNTTTRKEKQSLLIKKTIWHRKLFRRQLWEIHSKTALLLVLPGMRQKNKHWKISLLSKIQKLLFLSKHYCWLFKWWALTFKELQVECHKEDLSLECLLEEVHSLEFLKEDLKCLHFEEGELQEEWEVDPQEVGQWEIWEEDQEDQCQEEVSKVIPDSQQEDQECKCLCRHQHQLKDHQPYLETPLNNLTQSEEMIHFLTS